MVVQSLSEGVASALRGAWLGVIGFIPVLIGALVVLIVGLIVSAGLGALVEKVFELVKLDSFLSKLGLAPYVERSGLRLRGSHFLGRLVYWFFLVVTFLAISSILGLSAFSQFLQSVLYYIPNVVVAVLIMLAAVIVADFIKRLVKASAMSARLHAAHFLSSLAWWTVVIFGLSVALVQLDIASSIINELVTGLIVMIALAGGLAFGLGGKDYAAYLIGKLKEDLGSK